MEKHYKKVEAKTNLFINNNSLLDFPLKQRKINNNIIKTSNEDKKSLDFINKSNLIKNCVEYSNKKKLQKDIASNYNKNANITEMNKSTTQRNIKIENFQNMESSTEIKKGNNYKKISYNLKDLTSNDNNILKYNCFYQNNNNSGYLSSILINRNNELNLIEYNNLSQDPMINNTLRENYNKLFNQNENRKNKSKNENILIIDGDDMKYDEIKERKKNSSIDKVLQNKNKEINYNNNKNNINNNYNICNVQNNFSNTIFNISPNQIRESPLYERIVEPENGHSRGIIKMLKNFKDNSLNHQEHSFDKNEKNKNEEKIKKFENKQNKINDNNIRKNNIERKKIKCLNDQKMFDEPKNRTIMNQRNFSYKKKILKDRNNSTNKKKKIIKQDNNIFNHEDLIKNPNKTLSFNNNYEIKNPFLTKVKQDDLIENNIYYNKFGLKEEGISDKFYKKENYLYTKYVNNNKNIKKNNSFYIKLKNSKVNKFPSINNLNRNISDRITDINNNKKEENNFLNKTISESEINNKKRNQRIKRIGSPILNNKMEHYKNQFNDYLDDDISYQTLTNLSHTLRRNDSYTSKTNNMIKEIKINMKSPIIFNEKQNDNLFNSTNPYFYNVDNFNILHQKMNIENYKEKSNDDNIYENISQNVKKMMKMNSSINLNKKRQNILYSKPFKKKKNLKPFYYSNYNINDNSKSNSNYNSNKKMEYFSKTQFNNINEKGPFTSINIDFELFNKSERLNNFKENQNRKNRKIDINDEELWPNEKSLSKEGKKIYKKPIKKSNLNSSKMTPKKEEKCMKNSKSNKDEIIYIDRGFNILKNNKLNNRNITNNNKKIEDFNKIYNSFNSNYQSFCNIINKTKRIGFFTKYYNHCIKLPISKINYFHKKDIFKFKKKTNNKIFLPNISKCYFTKLAIINNKKDLKNNTNQIKFKQKNKEKNESIINCDNFNNKNKTINKGTIQNNNISHGFHFQSFKEEKIKKNKLENKRYYNENNHDKNVIRNNSIKRENKIEKYKIKTEKDSIKNDIIYLLNILVPKNILSVINQLTKLIITSSHLINIEKNEDNAKLFLNDIIKNENIFIEILVNKIIYENKFNEIYSKLCSDLCNKYLDSINEIIINKLIKTSNKDEYNIIKNLKLKLNEKCLNKLQDILNNKINDENKQKIFYLMNFICQSLDYGIIEIETCLDIIYKLFNEYEKNLENKYEYLDLIIYYILKLEKIDKIKDKDKILEKITFVINNDINEKNIPNYIKNRINKFKEIYKFEESIFNEEKRLGSKINFEGTALLIKEDMENYYNFLKNKKIDLKSNISENIESQYDWPIAKSLKKIDSEDIIKYYINICEYTLSNYEQVICYKSYIKNIVESISLKISLSKLRIFHNKILQVLSNIKNYCNKNIFMYEIIGNLLYVLIINELCDIKDINIFINKEEESKISICKAIKFTILSSGENIKKYYEDFKKIDLFKNNDIFEKYISLEIKDN